MPGRDPYDSGMAATSGTLLDPVAVDVVAAAVGRALQSELAQKDGSPSEREVPDWTSVDVEAIVTAARVHRVSRLLIDQADAVDIPNGIREQLLGIARANAMSGMRLALETVRAVETLTGAGIPALTFKGVALGVQTTGALSSRGAGDIDILVRPEDVRRTHEVLTAAGWDGEPIPDEGRWWTRYLRVRRERSYLAESSAIDLHWRVGWHDEPLPPAAELIARAESVDMASRRVPTLWLPDAFAATCYHATVDRYARLRSLVDVARLARRDDVTIPPGSSWRLRRLIAETVDLTDHLIGGIPAHRLEALVPAGHVDLPHLLGIWEDSSVRPAWIEADLSLAEVVGIYRESARYAGARAALSMALTDGLMPPERITADLGPVAAAAQMGGEVGDLVRRRVLNKPTDDSSPE